MKKSVMLISIALIAVWAVSAAAEDCIDIDLGAEVIEHEPYDILSIYFYAENCGTEPGVATFTASLDFNGEEVGAGMFMCYMPAGEPFIKELDLPIPPAVPPGTYTLCLTAELGTASDTACATVTIDGMGQIVAFEKDKDVMGTEEASWGAIKEQFE